MVSIGLIFVFTGLGEQVFISSSSLLSRTLESTLSVTNFFVEIFLQIFAKIFNYFWQNFSPFLPKFLLNIVYFFSKYFPEQGCDFDQGSIWRYDWSNLDTKSRKIYPQPNTTYPHHFPSKLLYHQLVHILTSNLQNRLRFSQKWLSSSWLWLWPRFFKYLVTKLLTNGKFWNIVEEYEK